MGERSAEGESEAVARLGKAVSSPRRIEILDALANEEASVEALAERVDLSVANTSQHLQVLRGAGLVVSRREGTFVFYRLSSGAVPGLLDALRVLARERPR